jgi:hypothetical protein
VTAATPDQQSRTLMEIIAACLQGRSIAAAMMDRHSRLNLAPAGLALRGATRFTFAKDHP